MLVSNQPATFRSISRSRARVSQLGSIRSNSIRRGLRLIDLQHSRHLQRPDRWSSWTTLLLHTAIG
jgi:hypothetical protein